MDSPWHSVELRGPSRTPPSFDFADQRFRGLPVYRISHGIQLRQTGHRPSIVGCNNPIRAQARRLDLAFENPGDHYRAAILRSEYRRAPDVADGSGDEHRLTCLNYGSHRDQ